jgi:hypothetical protein
VLSRAASGQTSPVSFLASFLLLFAKLITGRLKPSSLVLRMSLLVNQ